MTKYGITSAEKTWYMEMDLKQCKALVAWLVARSYVCPFVHVLVRLLVVPPFYQPKYLVHDLNIWTGGEIEYLSY